MTSEEDDLIEDEEEAIDWFNSLNAITRRNLVITQYKLNMSLKDTALKKMLTASNKKWKTLVEEKDSHIKMLQFENDAITNTLSKLNSNTNDNTNNTNNTNKNNNETKTLMNSVINEILKLEGKIDASVKLQRDPIKAFNELKDYYSHIEVILSNVKGYSYKKVESTTTLTKYDIYINTKNLKGYIECYNEDCFTNDIFDNFKNNIKTNDNYFTFAICILPKVKFVKNSTFFIEFFETDFGFGTTLLVCVCDTIMHTERINNCLNIIETYIDYNNKTNTNLKINKNIGKIQSQIKHLKEINEKLMCSINENNNVIVNLHNVIETIINSKDTIKETIKETETKTKTTTATKPIKEIATAKETAKETTISIAIATAKKSSNDSESDSETNYEEIKENTLLKQLNTNTNTNTLNAQKICLDVVKYYLINKQTKYTIKDIVSKAEKFGVPKTMGSVIIKQLGALKGITDLAKKDISMGNMPSNDFKFEI